VIDVAFRNAALYLLAMIKANALKTGAVVAIDGAPCVLEQVTVQTPSARGGASLYKLRFRNAVSGQKVDRSCKGDQAFQDVELRRRPIQFSYQRGDSYVFTDLDDYSEIMLMQHEIEREAPYFDEDTEGLQALVCDGRVIGIELPPVVEMPVVECEPSIRGASATARPKPATMPTGLVVNVPEYLSPGETIRIDTRTGEFLGRA